MDQAAKDFEKLRAALDEEKARYDAKLKAARGQAEWEAKLDDLKKELEAARKESEGLREGATGAHELETHLKFEQERVHKLQDENLKLQAQAAEVQTLANK